MMKEWTDRMNPRDAAEVWQRSIDEEVIRRISRIEDELRQALNPQQAAPLGFYDAMSHFIRLRDKLFPNLPADPAWKILLTLAQTPAGSDKASVTGISHGAGVPLTTVLRYLAIMEVDGIIQRVPHPADRRQIMISLTDEGRRRLDQIAQTWAMKLVVALAAPLMMLLCVRQAWAG